MLMHVPTGLCLLGVIDKVVHRALERARAAGRVRGEFAAGLHGEVGGLLHRLDGKVPCRGDHHAPLAAHPGDNGRPILVVVPPPGLTRLATPPGRAAQRFRPARLGLSLVAGGVIEVVSLDRPRQLPLPLIGQSRIAQPPAPAVPRADMHAPLSGNTPRGTRQAQQKGRTHPVHHRALAAIQERPREVIAGALAALLFTALAFQAWLGMVRAPGPDVEALTAGTLEGPILPAQRMDGGLTRCGVEEVVEMRHHRHG
jgi:hypothetical protein